MRCIIRWLKLARATQPDHQQRFENLLSAARRSVYYRRRRVEIPQDAAAEPEAMLRILKKIPPVELNSFLRNPADFYNWTPAPPELQTLESHLPTTGRTALLATGFRETELVKCFSHQPFDEIAEYQPESLAGALSRLCRLAELVLERRIELPSVRHAVIAFTGLRHGCLKNAHRELLWRAFQVPVYEQFRGFGQELLAWECEAREGLHIDSNNALFEVDEEGRLLVTCPACSEYVVLRLVTDMSARLHSSPCGCGVAGTRLEGLRAELVVEKYQVAIA
ncbi:MAG: hypothetical protein JNL98_06860 [Bryobacterales bacterium]|nr:hypothetical protein [Bryobacterales bacterium]